MGGTTEALPWLGHRRAAGKNQLGEATAAEGGVGEDVGEDVEALDLDVP